MARVKAGEQMPDLTLCMYPGTEKKLSDFRGEKVFLRVLRYIGCPTCRMDIHEMNMRSQEFADKNTRLMVVIQSDAEHVKADLERTDEALHYDLVLDPEMKIYRELDITAAKDKDGLHGDDQEKYLALREKVKAGGYVHGDFEGEELQLPALFLIGEDGTVLYSHYAVSIADMPGVDEMLQLL